MKILSEAKNDRTRGFMKLDGILQIRSRKLLHNSVANIHQLKFDKS